jgi:hypothetical protein
MEIAKDTLVRALPDVFGERTEEDARAILDGPETVIGKYGEALTRL